MRSSRRRRGGSIVLAPFVGALIVLAALVGGPATSVLAHAEVIEVVPASNSVLPEAPTEITVTFSEPVSLNGGSTEVFDDTGEPVVSEGRVSDSTVVIELPEQLADGSYVVAWRVISADSHPISGTSVFSVGAPSVGAPVDVDAGPQVPAIASAWRVLAMAVTYGGVLASIGVWWLARRWHRLAAELDDDIADDTTRPPRSTTRSAPRCGDSIDGRCGQPQQGSSESSWRSPPGSSPSVERGIRSATARSSPTR